MLRRPRFFSGLACLCPVDDNSKKVEDRGQYDSAKRWREKIEPGDHCVANQEYEAKYQQEPGAKEECAVANREAAIGRWKENKAETKTSIEADPDPPHCGFLGDARRDGHHLGGKIWVARTQIRPAGV